MYYGLIYVISILWSGAVSSYQVKAEMNEPTAIKITCEITAAPIQTLGESIWVSFSVQSNMTNTIQVLTWHTPLEGIFSPIFKIIDKEGNLLSYQGPLIKRAAPTEADYINLKPNEKLTNKVNLSNVYNFEQQQSYFVSLESLKIEIINQNKTRQTTHCDSNELTISIK